MGAVGGSKGVVDVEVGVGCELLGELGGVLLLVLVETDVLQKDELREEGGKVGRQEGAAGPDLKRRIRAR